MSRETGPSQPMSSGEQPEKKGHDFRIERIIGGYHFVFEVDNKNERPVQSTFNLVDKQITIRTTREGLNDTMDRIAQFFEHDDFTEMLDDWTMRLRGFRMKLKEREKNKQRTDDKKRIDDFLRDLGFSDEDGGDEKIDE